MVGSQDPVRTKQSVQGIFMSKNHADYSTTAVDSTTAAEREE